MYWVRVCRLLAALFAPLLLVGCLETVGAPHYVVPTVTSSTGARPAQDVRARLESQCIDESGAIIRTDEKIGKQCGCYASTMMKSMSKEDLDFFSTYGVVPTLHNARPDDVRKQCGLAVTTYLGPRGKLPPPETY